VAKIEDITPEPEPEPEEEPTDTDAGEDNDESGNTPAPTPEPTNEAPTQDKKATPQAPAVDVPFTITNEVPEDSKPVADQLSLF
jgi:hypothetical protein